MIEVTESNDGHALALETSSALGSIALGWHREIVETVSLSGPRRHAMELLPAIASLCSRNGVEPSSIKQIMLSIGPGSFTGLRIGVTVARMMAMTTGATIVSVPTLSVIAQNALGVTPAPPNVAVILDAKRGRVYAGRFRHVAGQYIAESTAQEHDPADFLRGQPASCAVLGEGVPYHHAAVEQSGLTVLPRELDAPLAETVMRLGWQMADDGKTVERRNLVPTYIRPPEAEEKWAERQALEKSGS